MDMHAALHALGFGPLATPSAAEVKTAYHKLILLKHPDKGGDPNEFSLLQEAMRLLTGTSSVNNVDHEEEEAQRLYDDISDFLARGDLNAVTAALPNFWDIVSTLATPDKMNAMCNKLSERLMSHVDAALVQFDNDNSIREFVGHVASMDLSGINHEYILWFINTVWDKAEARIEEIGTMRQQEKLAAEKERMARDQEIMRRMQEAYAQTAAQQISQDTIQSLRQRAKAASTVADKARDAAAAKGRELDAAKEAHAASLAQSLRDAEALLAAEEALRIAQEERDRLASAAQAAFEREERDRELAANLEAEKQLAEAEAAAAAQAAAVCKSNARDASKQAAEKHGRAAKRIKAEVIEILD